MKKFLNTIKTWQDIEYYPYDNYVPEEKKTGRMKKIFVEIDVEKFYKVMKFTDEEIEATYKKYEHDTDIEIMGVIYMTLLERRIKISDIADISIL